MIGLVKTLSALTHAICAHTEQLKHDAERCKSHEGLATKQDLREMEQRMADTFKQWAADNGPKLKRIQDGIDRAQALIEKIQNSPGTFSTEDQGTANELEAVLDAIGTDADSVPTPPGPPSPA